MNNDLQLVLNQLFKDNFESAVNKATFGTVFSNTTRFLEMYCKNVMIYPLLGYNPSFPGIYVEVNLDDDVWVFLISTHETVYALRARKEYKCTLDELPEVFLRQVRSHYETLTR